jgi:hypothetical protein
VSTYSRLLRRVVLCCGLQLLQVSHHPPVSAAHAENSSWTYDIVSAPTTKFLGNSLEVYPKGERSSSAAWLERSTTIQGKQLNVARPNSCSQSAPYGFSNP